MKKPPDNNLWRDYCMIGYIQQERYSAVKNIKEKVPKIKEEGRK
jgi:hypothetical protein